MFDLGLESISLDMMKRYNILALEENNKEIKIAVDEDFDREVRELLEFMLCKSISTLVVDRKIIIDGLSNRFNEVNDKKIGSNEINEELQVIANSENKVAQIINEGIARGASDIHWERQANNEGLLVRYRIDGRLIDFSFAGVDTMGLKIISYLKIMSHMCIDEKRLPQDGRMAWVFGEKKYDLRVSSLSTVHGESLAIRILDREDLNLNVEELGLCSEEWTQVQGLLNKPDGLLLITGPTGSGKTTTLYSALNYRSQFDGKIITVEDPIEYEFSHFLQIPVRAGIGMTFASALRAMLRQSPDTIMIGEIRDLETAQIAMNAALTGHLVLSTLHTNDALSAIYRLMDLSLESYQIAAALRGVISQRLVRKLCSFCKEPYTPSEEELSLLNFLDEDIDQIIFYHGKGCMHCHYSGFKGRLGVFEILPLTPELSRLINAAINPEELSNYIKSLGMSNLRQGGIRKIREGLTTIEEVVAAIVL